MGEALEGAAFARMDRRQALLEVVRLAFEGSGLSSSDMQQGTVAEEVPEAEAEEATAAGTPRHKWRSSKELVPQAAPPNPPHRPASTGSSSRLVPGGPCMWCAVTATPQWRRPRGTNKLLCNACGIFFTRYGRLPERTQAHPAPVAAPAATATACSAMAQLLASSSNGEQQPQPALERVLGQEQDGGVMVRCMEDGAMEDANLSEMQQQQQQQRASPASFWLSGASPLKRKDAPQPEAELLRCLEQEEAVASLAGDSMGGAGHHSQQQQPALPPLASLSNGHAFLAPQPGQAAPGLGRTVSGPPAHASGSAASAPVPSTTPTPTGGPAVSAVPAPFMPSAPAAPSASAPAPDPSHSMVLTVTPLDLGLPLGSLQAAHPHNHQQLGLMHQPMVGLAPLPSLCLSGSAASTSAAASACGSSSYPPHHRTHAPLSMLPPDFLGRPFSLPPGLLPGGVSLFDPAGAAPPPRSLYGRPPKRQERLPAGDSDDSNVSTDSRATHGDAGVLSHDEDDGGTATTTGTATTATMSALGLSCSPTSMPGLHFPPSLFTRQPALPLLPGLAGSAGTGAVSMFGWPPHGSPGGMFGAGGGGAATVVASGHHGAVSATALAGMAAPRLAFGNGGGGMAFSADAAMAYAQQQQPSFPQQPIIFLPTRRCKGPRSRGSSATPSSSTQS